jgi:hypothetical protein
MDARVAPRRELAGRQLIVLLANTLLAESGNVIRISYDEVRDADRPKTRSTAGRDENSRWRSREGPKCRWRMSYFLRSWVWGR